MKSKKFHGYKVAFACFLIMFAHMGAIGFCTIMFVPISDATQIPLNDLMVMLTFSTVTAVLGGFLAPHLIPKITPKYSLLFATVVLTVSTAGFGLSNTLEQFCMFAALNGFVLSFGTNACISTIISSWFIEKRSQILGMVFAAGHWGRRCCRCLVEF